jgi:hypothetical protein
MGWVVVGGVVVGGIVGRSLRLENSSLCGLWIGLVGLLQRTVDWKLGGRLEAREDRRGT